MKISVNDNFNSLINYINSEKSYILIRDFLQFGIENKMYKDVYLHWHIFIRLIDEHNQIVRAKKNERL